MKPTKLVQLEREPGEQSEYDKDVWDLRKLGIAINLSRADYKLNFTRITQTWLRQAAKKLAKYTLSTKSASNTTAKLLALKDFSAFLNKSAPSIQPVDINRPIIVEYLSYLSSRKLAVQTRRNHICYLSIFLDLCNQEGWADIKRSGLIHRGDIPKQEKYQPRYIPKEVVDQLNQHLDCLPPYILRMVLILQETGRRVGEVCTMPFNCLMQDAQGDWFLRHYQSKMKKEKSIPISKELVAVILEQQEVVKNEYGLDCSYLFPQPQAWCQGQGEQRKGKPMYQKNINKLLNELAKKRIFVHQQVISGIFSLINSVTLLAHQ